MSILFTQYLRPDGRKRGVEIDMSQEVEDLAKRFIAAGGRYECEELTTGHASLTAVYEVDAGGLTPALPAFDAGSRPSIYTLDHVIYPRSRCTSAGAPPSNPSSATSRRITAWAGACPMDAPAPRK